MTDVVVEVAVVVDVDSVEEVLLVRVLCVDVVDVVVHTPHLTGQAALTNGPKLSS